MARSVALSALTAFLFCQCAGTPNAAAEPDVAQPVAVAPVVPATKPRVLILGDSISMGYTPGVTSLLQDAADVMRPKENCAGTTKGVQRLDAWLTIDGGGFDLIWFNFGLHDLKHVDAETGKNSNDPSDPRQAEPDVYERQLREIVQRLLATGAELVFATTTPVPPGGVRPHRDLDDPQRYNQIARGVMAEHGIPICDLFAFADARRDEIMRPANVHFTKAGSQLLAEQVAARIRALLLEHAGTRSHG